MGQLLFDQLKHSLLSEIRDNYTKTGINLNNVPIQTICDLTMNM